MKGLSDSSVIRPAIPISAISVPLNGLAVTNSRKLGYTSFAKSNTNIRNTGDAAGLYYLLRWSVIAYECIEIQLDYYNEIVYHYHSFLRVYSSLYSLKIRVMGCWEQPIARHFKWLEKEKPSPLIFKVRERTRRQRAFFAQSFKKAMAGSQRIANSSPF